ncbi:MULTISPECIES: type II secretion system F family protein [Achromobacter]|uniref:type II secretion system F family protein n=1 Tax=Achromobacter TaxID=222 RepID=UPI0017845D4D|nr:MULTISPECIES: type II secretion system F family protein [Achromobacter]MBD9423549.1 type II secretion system F family protein [Achromobacter sp. ACM04]MBD9477223.1 type II secretion system F family protein [Achromobacter sp. ACM01]
MWLYLSLLTAALAAGWLAWVVFKPLLLDSEGASSALPWWWRAAWPWISAVAPVAGPLCSWRWRIRLTRAIERAALPAGISYAHVAALCWSAAMAAGGLTAAVAIVLAQAQSWEWIPWMVASALAAGAAPGLWLRNLSSNRRRSIERDLPFVFDMMTLCVEAGLSVHGALQMAAQSGPAGILRDALADALAEMRAGVSRTAAIKALAERSNSPLARNWAAALAQAEGLGISLGPVLRAQAAQARSDRHVRAEQLAMQAPVKMLLPLIGCIFPCTFIVLAFPVMVQLLQSVQ